jgi:hypothetical protein
VRNIVSSHSLRATIIAPFLGVISILKKDEQQFNIKGENRIMFT